MSVWVALCGVTTLLFGIARASAETLQAAIGVLLIAIYLKIHEETR